MAQIPASKFPNVDVALHPLINSQKFLDARTAGDSVGIANQTDDPFTGTHWTAQEVSPGIITLRLTLFPSNRFLDGRTQDGSVGLAEAADDAHSGVFWEPIITDHVVNSGPGILTNEFDVWILRCLGALDGSRFLDYRSQNDTVGLAPFIDGPFTGTRWVLVLNPERQPPVVR
jgi:hypothetical protein